MVHLDEVLAKFKLSEPYYAQFLTLMCIGYMSNSWYSENYVFTVDDIGYRCKDARFENDSCAALNNSTDVCTEWVYDNPDSFVAYFQLACQDWKRTLVGTLHNFGYMIGLLIVGPLSDSFGRKYLLIITAVLGGVFGITRSLVTSYWFFVILEFLEGAIGDSSAVVFMMIIEITPKNKRILSEMVCVQGYAVGAIFLALAGWLFPNWRTLLQVLYTPALLFFLYIFVMDESPRWLLSKGRKDEAVAILKKVCHKSKSDIGKDILDNVSYENSKGLGYIQLLKETFRSRILLTRFFICCVWWTSATFVSYGISINSVYLAGNKYVNYGLRNIVTTPGAFLALLLMKQYKRKTALMLSFFAAALFLIAQPFVPVSLPWLSVTLFMIGTLISSTFLEITYIFTSEMFPTYTRSSMHGLCSSIGRIGSIVAPQTPLLMVYWPGLPSLLFGAASLIAGAVTMLAPDTTNDDALPDTIRQAEAFGKEPQLELRNEINLQ